MPLVAYGKFAYGKGIPAIGMPMAYQLQWYANWHAIGIPMHRFTYAYRHRFSNGKGFRLKTLRFNT